MQASTLKDMHIVVDTIESYVKTLYMVRLGTQVRTPGTSYEQYVDSLNRNENNCKRLNSNGRHPKIIQVQYLFLEKLH